MNTVRACRICLIMGVKMFDLRRDLLEDYFETVVGLNPFMLVELPQFACYECSTLLRKYNHFREKCLKGQAVLYDILHKHQQITENEIQAVDRNSLDLSSNLSLHLLTEEGHKYTNYDVKEETKPQVESKIDVEVDVIKVEINLSSPIESTSDFVNLPSPLAGSSDDEPLSLCRSNKEVKKVRKKIGKKEKKVGRRKKKECFSESPENSDLDVGKLELLCPDTGKFVEQKKAGRPPKPSAKVKTTKNNDDLNIEEYVTTIKLSLKEQLEEIENRKTSSNYLNAPLKCEVCFKGFVDSHAYKHHMTKHDPSSGEVECPICKFRFASKRLLQKHSINHEKKYVCKSCSYVSKTTTQAKQHQKWHKGVTYKCPHCDEVSTKWTSYLSHLRIKHPSSFICGACGYSFVSKLGLAMHRTMMHKEEATVMAEERRGPYCADCDVQFTSTEAWKRHMVTSANHLRSEDRHNGCRVCGDTFGSAEELRLHHRRAHARKRPKNYGKKPSDVEWPIKCQHCDDQIPNARDYWAHFRRVHPDQKYPIQKSYICEICGKGFRGNAFLVYHKRTHFEERAYKCVQCPKAFYNRTNLQMHEKTHSEHRPYPCSVCFKAFKLKGALDRHFRSHTGVKPYACEFCGKAFGQSNSRKLHVRTVHLKQPAPYLSRSRQERRRALLKPSYAPDTAAAAAAVTASAPFAF